MVQEGTVSLFLSLPLSLDSRIDATHQPESLKPIQEIS